MGLNTIPTQTFILYQYISIYVLSAEPLRNSVTPSVSLLSIKNISYLSDRDIQFYLFLCILVLANPISNNLK